jgi:hypothetical protein
MVSIALDNWQLPTEISSSELQNLFSGKFKKKLGWLESRE